MKLINRFSISASFILFSLTNSFGQTPLPAGSICLGTDTAVCAGQPVTIVNCPVSGGTPSGAFNLPNPTNVTLFDDQWSGIVPIGFTFNFYGNNHTSCVIGSNGLVSFNLGNAGGFCPWTLNGVPLPTATVPGGMNAAMGCYEDLNPSNTTAGPIQYQTVGIAPNRIFVVLYKGVTAFSCTQSCNYSSIMLYETSNKIEYHIGTKAVCTWNGGRAVQGTQNAAATVAHITTGRNNSNWAAVSDGKRFLPTSPTNTMAYAISTIPYIPVTSNGTSSPIIWKNTLNQTFPYNGTTNSLTVTNPPIGTTGYFLSGTACGVAIGAISDTTWISVSNATVTATSITDTCMQGVGVVTANPGAGVGPFTFNWPTIPGGNTASVANVTSGVYSVTMTTSVGCTATTAVAVQNISTTATGTTTMVSCPGGSNGTATATMTPNSAGITYLWNDPAAQTTQTAVGLAAGTYTCTLTNLLGCTNVVTVNVGTIPGMVANITNQVDVNCHASNTGIITVNVTAGTTPYNYAWSGSASTTATANDLFVGAQSVNITDANGCLVTLNTVLAEPPALYIDSVSTDSVICSESSIIIGAVGAGGSTPYIYTWYENGTQFSNAQYVTVDPVSSGTQYVVVLSEVCGSPTDSDTLVITFPLDIIPLATPVPYEACAPDTFQFLNTSVNAGDIATTVWTFSNGNTFTVPAQNSVSDYFDIAGLYDATMTVTSNYGCVYTNNFPQIISALPTPIAKFSMTTNPTTIFETTVGMIDKSIDASQWFWSVPDAQITTTSTVQNPVFNFPHTEGNYEVILIITSPKGCLDTTWGVLEVKSDFILYAPNTFTPDGDQFNQNWHIVTEGLDFNDFDLQVYNRWGEVVWQSKDPEAEWDGTYDGRIVPQGNYNWKLRTKKIGTDEPQIFTGSVLIIR